MTVSKPLIADIQKHLDYYSQQEVTEDPLHWSDNLNIHHLIALKNHSLTMMLKCCPLNTVG